MKIKEHRDGISLASSYAFDSTWLSFLALQGAMKNLHRKNITLDSNCTSDTDTVKTVKLLEIMNQFKKINFQGVTVSRERNIALLWVSVSSNQTICF